MAVVLSAERVASQMWQEQQKLEILRQSHNLGLRGRLLKCLTSGDRYRVAMYAGSSLMMIRKLL